MLGSPEDAFYVKTMQSLNRFEGDIQRVLAKKALALQELLAAHFCGHDFGSLANNQAVASQINLSARRLGHRFLCRKCKQPADLRCSRTNRSKHGSFQFEHYNNSRRTHHCGHTVVPDLLLVPMQKQDLRSREARRMSKKM